MSQSTSPAQPQNQPSAIPSLSPSSSSSSSSSQPQPQHVNIFYGANNVLDDLAESMRSGDHVGIERHSNELFKQTDDICLNYDLVNYSNALISAELSDDIDEYLNYKENINMLLSNVKILYPQLNYNFAISTEIRPNFIKFKDGKILWCDFASFAQAMIIFSLLATSLYGVAYYIFGNKITKVTITAILSNINMINFIEKYKKDTDDAEFYDHNNIFINPNSKISNNKKLIDILLKSLDICIINNVKELSKIIKKGVFYFIPRSIKNNKFTIEYFKNILNKYKEKKENIDLLYFPSGTYYFLDLGFTLKNPLYIN